MKQIPANIDASPPATELPSPPVAARKPHDVVSPHGTRSDEYYWLRDDSRENPEMLAHLHAENAYADRMLAHTKALETRVYGEIVARLKQDDSTVPVRYRGHWYWIRYATGQEYPIVVRRPDTSGAAETVLLDCNALAQGVRHRHHPAGCGQRHR